MNEEVQVDTEQLTENANSEVSDQLPFEAESKSAKEQISKVEPSDKTADSKSTIHPSVNPFLDMLPQIFNKETFELDFRYALNGLFFNEEHLSKIVQAYENFCKQQFDLKDTLPFSKLLSRLLSDEKIIQYYLLEGKSCKSGYLIELSPEHKKISLIPNHPGKALAAIDYLHPRDPLFEQIPDLVASTGKNGLEFRVTTTQGKSFKFDLEFLKRFLKLAYYSKSISKYHPRFYWGQREGLRALVKIFKKAEICENTKLLIPKAFRLEKAANYYKLANYVFVQIADDLKSIYELKSSNLNFFMRTQLQDQKFTLKASNDKYFPPPSQGKSKHWGQFIIRDNRYPLRSTALIYFYQHLQHSEVLLDKLPQFYTVRDVLNLFLELLVKAERLNTPGLINSLEYIPRKDEELREVDKLIFVLSINYEIRDFFPRYQERYKKGVYP